MPQRSLSLSPFVVLAVSACTFTDSLGHGAPDDEGTGGTTGGQDGSAASSGAGGADGGARNGVGGGVNAGAAGGAGVATVAGGGGSAGSGSGGSDAFGGDGSGAFEAGGSSAGSGVAGAATGSGGSAGASGDGGAPGAGGAAGSGTGGDAGSSGDPSAGGAPSEAGATHGGNAGAASETGGSAGSAGGHGGVDNAGGSETAGGGGRDAEECVDGSERTTSCGITGAGIAISVCEGGQFGPFGPCSEISARSIVAGEMHSCVLLEDDSAYCWGANQYGQLNVPTGERFTELAAVADATCGLRFDGTVACWGRVGTNTFDDFRFRHLGRIGMFCAIGLTEEGLLRGFIDCGDYAGLADAETFQTSSGWRCGATPSGAARCNGAEYRVEGAHFVEAAQGYGRTEDGRVYQVTNGSQVPGRYRRVIAHDRWNGSTQYCLIDESGRPSCEVETTLLPAGDDYVDLTFGRYHTCGRRSNGEVRCVSSYPTFENPAPTAGRFTQIQVGYNAACASREDGTLTCWGALDDAVTPDEPFDSFSVHYRRACGLRDGLVNCWGYETFSLSDLPGYLQGAHFLNVDVGDGATCGVLADTIDAGKVLCWGYYSYDAAAPSYWLERQHAPYRRASVGRNFYYCLESEAGGIRCRRPPADFSPFAAGTTFASWVAGYEVACGLTPEGSALCNRSSNTPPTELFSQLDVNSTACGVTLDERIVCWGGDRYGITHLPHDASYQQVAIGEEFACGLRTDGSVNCWGFYDFGQDDLPGSTQIPQ